MRAITLTLAAALLATSAAWAKPPAHAGKPDRRAAAATEDAGDGGPLLRDDEAAIAEVIIEAVTGEAVDLNGDERDGGDAAKGGPPKGLPPGLAKRDRLPPGLQRHVERTGQLPPGLQKRVTDGVERRLPGHEAEIRGTDLLLKDATTGEIVKVIHDILRATR